MLFNKKMCSGYSNQEFKCSPYGRGLQLFPKKAIQIQLFNFNFILPMINMVNIIICTLVFVFKKTIFNGKLVQYLTHRPKHEICKRIATTEYGKLKIKICTNKFP